MLFNLNGQLWNVVRSCIVKILPSPLLREEVSVKKNQLLFVLKEEMERLQQNIETLKAEAAEDGEEQVTAKA